MKCHKCYSELPQMEIFAGSATDKIIIDVERDGEAVDCSDYTMRLTVSDVKKPEKLVISKTIAPDSETKSRFTTWLTAKETAGLDGVYRLVFSLYQNELNTYKSVSGLLHVKPCVCEV